MSEEFVIFIAFIAAVGVGFIVGSVWIANWVWSNFKLEPLGDDNER